MRQSLSPWKLRSDCQLVVHGCRQALLYARSFHLKAAEVEQGGVREGVMSVVGRLHVIFVVSVQSASNL